MTSPADVGGPPGPDPPDPPDPPDSADPTTILQRLVGAPCTWIGRVGCTGLIEFGPDVSSVLLEGRETVTGSRFALHIECPFRVVQGDKIFVGSDDLLIPAGRREGEDGGGHNEDEWLAYDVGAGVLRSFLDRKAPLVVAVRTRPVGDLQVELEHGITIEVLPTSLKRRESWRFFERFAEHVTFPDRPRSRRP